MVLISLIQPTLLYLIQVRQKERERNIDFMERKYGKSNSYPVPLPHPPVVFIVLLHHLQRMSVWSCELLSVKPKEVDYHKLK